MMVVAPMGRDILFHSFSRLRMVSDVPYAFRVAWTAFASTHAARSVSR